MRIVLAGVVAALALASATVAATSPAQARVTFGVSINADDVRFAYRDGYWDRFHRWHPWSDPDDWRWYRRHYRERYFDWAHDRDPDLGWRVGVVGVPAGVMIGGPRFEVGVGDIVYAYRDGYWDRFHRWHAWRTPAEWSWWRAHHPDAYWDWRHDRDADMGWRVAGGPVGVEVGVPGFEVGVGDIVFAYRDGYWDRFHRWHFWHGEAERVWWRDHHPGTYWDWRHDRDRDMGWRRDDWRDRH